MRDQKDHKRGDHHLQELRSGGQPEEQTGRPDQNEEEGKDPHDHAGNTIQENPDPLDQRQGGNRKEQ